MATIAQAILEINPNAEVSINGEDIDNIIWHDGTTPISKSDIESKINEIETRDAHIEPRKNSYPSIQEQLDMMWHDKQNNTTTWEDAISKVKSDNPKASE
jgi:hypothetical protein